MINPALEYLSRNPEILRPYLPCSIMANGVEGKIVTALHPVEDPSLMCRKVWSIEKGEAGNILPPNKSDIVSRRLLDYPWQVLPKGSKPVGYMSDLPSTRHNTNNRAIPKPVYDQLGTDFLFSSSHKNHREAWVWAGFEKMYAHKLGVVGKPSYFSAVVRQDLKTVNVRLFQYWQMWKMHMLDFPGDIAPELFYWASAVSSSLASAFSDPWL